MSLAKGERHIREDRDTIDKDYLPYISSQEVCLNLFNTNVVPTKPPCFTLYFMQIYWTNEPLILKCTQQKKMSLNEYVV